MKLAVLDDYQRVALEYADWKSLQGAAHPFVSKEAVERYHRVLLECYEAQLAWRMGS